MNALVKSISILFLGVLWGSCSSDSTKATTALSAQDSLKISDSIFRANHIIQWEINRIDSFEVGDVNGDHKNDMARIQPLTFYVHNGKIDSQFVHITFSCDIPSIKHYNGFHGIVANATDLDGNGTDEILYFPDWYQSNEGTVYVYGYTTGNWKVVAKGSLRSDVVFEHEKPIQFLQSRVRKISNRSFILIEHIWVEGGTTYVDSSTVFRIEQNL